MASVLANYKELNTKLKKTKALLDTTLVKPILFQANRQFIKTLRSQIEAAEEQCERAIQIGYMTPLRVGLKRIITKLNDLDDNGNVEIKKYVFMTLLVNAAVQLNDQEFSKPITVLRSIGSHLFESYEQKLREFKIKSSSISHNCSPLIGFFGQLPNLPFNDKPRLPLPRTLTVPYLRDYLGKSIAKDFKVGTLGLLPGLIKYPIWWGVLGHEIGGHYILSADDRLLPELQSKVYTKLCSRYPSPPLDSLAALWRFWIEEAASDIRGVLLLGPSAGIGTISAYTALAPLVWEAGGTLTSIYSSNDWHPVPILIPDLICGAVDSLNKLSVSRKVRYVAQLEEIARYYSNPRGEVNLGSNAFVRDPGDPNNKKKFTTLPKKLPLKDMQESARFVGNYIASVELDTLGGHSLKDLAGWTDDQEDTALLIAEQLTAPIHIDELKFKKLYDPTPMQLITGGILAAVRQPNRYEDVNRFLFDIFSRHL